MCLYYESRVLTLFLGEDIGSVFSPPKKLLNNSQCPSFCPLGWHTAGTLSPGVVDSFLTHTHTHTHTHPCAEEVTHTHKYSPFQTRAHTRRARYIIFKSLFPSPVVENAGWFCHIIVFLLSSSFFLSFFSVFFFFFFFAFPNPPRLSAPLISILGLLSCLLSCQISSHRFSTMYALLSPWCRYFGIVGKTSLCA